VEMPCSAVRWSTVSRITARSSNSAAHPTAFAKAWAGYLSLASPERSPNRAIRVSSRCIGQGSLNGLTPKRKARGIGPTDPTVFHFRPRPARRATSGPLFDDRRHETDKFFEMQLSILHAEAVNNVLAGGGPLQGLSSASASAKWPWPWVCR